MRVSEGKAFRLPPWRKQLIASKFRAMDAATASSVRDMEAVMFAAIETILSRAERNGWKFEPPAIQGMNEALVYFYRRAITAGWEHAKEEAAAQGLVTHHRLAKITKGKIPPVRDLVHIFEDKNTWPKIMKRSEQLTDRLRAAYLEKLRKKFNEVVPRMESGEVTPRDIEEELRNAWRASKSRVSTIFRTETTRYFAQAQRAYFDKQPGILGYLFDSVADASRSKWCSDRHGLIYRADTPAQKKKLDKNTPPCHWSCRSHLIALASTPANRKMLNDPARDPLKRRVKKLPDGWNS